MLIIDSGLTLSTAQIGRYPDTMTAIREKSPEENLVMTIDPKRASSTAAAHR
jgi:hypothetical protein